MRTCVHALGVASILVVGAAALAADPDAFLRLLPDVDAARGTDALFGATLFRTRWDGTGDARARAGVGPNFDAVSCQECHPRAGRGLEPTARVLRLEPPDARYGGTLSRRAAGGAPEAVVSFELALAGASSRRIEPVISHLARGPLPAHTTVSMRIAPQLAGLGLLEAIPAAAIQRQADPDDRDGDGVSGRVAWVQDGDATALGRFGWRAESASIRSQVVRALATDMDVRTTSPSEIAPADVDRLAAFVRLLAPPAAPPLDPAGEAEGARLFARLGCARCHVPAWTTATVDGAPERSERRIQPYTDLLLHDMGSELADRRLDGRPSAREWRTPPLWGLGQITPSHEDADDLRLLHDGRARTVLDAVAAHGGEAADSREQVLALEAAERELLERFVRSR